MRPETESAIGTLPGEIRAPLLAFAQGEMPANMALMHLCMAAPDDAALENVLDVLRGHVQEPRFAELAALWRGRPDVFQTVKSILALVDHAPAALSPDALLAQCGEAFDRAGLLSPEASVALYSLGDPELLAAATGEIAAWMRAQNLLGPEKAALEIGCGNGRFLEALAGDLGHVIGLDISAVMIADARRHCADLANVTVAQTAGRDLGFCADASLDLVFAVDSFPYIVRCGTDLASRHFREAARVLRQGGRFLILNYSYRGNPGQDTAEIAEFATAAGFRLLRTTQHDFRLWDGATFLLRKEECGAPAT